MQGSSRSILTKLYSEYINKCKQEYNLLQVESVKFDKDKELTRDTVCFFIVSKKREEYK